MEQHIQILSQDACSCSGTRELRKYQEALLLEGRVIKMREKLLGPDHRDTLNIKHNHALTLEKLKRYKKAEKLEEEVIERCKRIFGPNHKDTLESKFNNAYALSKLGKIKEAEMLSGDHI